MLIGGLLNMLQSVVIYYDSTKEAQPGVKAIKLVLQAHSDPGHYFAERIAKSPHKQNFTVSLTVA